MKRGNFIKAIPAFPLIAQSAMLTDKQNEDWSLATERDEPFWDKFRRQFHIDNTYLDFRCNAASSLPKTGIKHLLDQLNHIEALPSARNPGLASGDKEPLRTRIATVLNANVGEVALMRNTTEALNTVIMGFPFEKGDEVIACTHEYDSMIGSLHQQEIRKGITLKQIDVPYQPESAEQIVECYRKAITPKTRMFLISHIIWISGQIYPLKELCELARQHGIYTVIDGAQSFSHIPTDVREIGCDYFGSSLHKWAAAPLGTGFLYVEQQHISRTMPLFGNYHYLPDDNNIEKFESLGTITPVFRSAALSMELWEKLGAQVKTERMQELKEYWVRQVAENDKINILTNLESEHSCGIVFFSIKDKSATELTKVLKREHNIITQAIENYRNHYVDYKDVNAVGIATSVFNTKKQLDRLGEVLNVLAG